MISRRTLLGLLAGSPLLPHITRPARASVLPAGGSLRHGWDPDVEGPVSATLFVAPDGDDAARGSLEQPLRTIQRGVDLLAQRPGGSLSIRGGIYRERVSLSALQGRPGAEYRLHRHGRERVTITAAEVLSGWRPCPPAEAARLGLAAEGTFVVRIPRARLDHGSYRALNLHEAGAWRSIVIDRADPSDPARTGDETTFHTAQFLLDEKDRIVAIRDPRLRGLSAEQMRNVRARVYRRPNVVGGAAIESFDPATGTLLLANRKRRVQRIDGRPVMRYALENLPTALRDGYWHAREDGEEIAIYFRPRDPANLDGGIEMSVRTNCIDFGRARHVELFGLEAVRAAGTKRSEGACIRRWGRADEDRSLATSNALRIVHCRAGETHDAGSSYGALYMRSVRGLTIHATSIGPARSSFGMFLSRARDVDMRNLHISGVSKSPARFFGLRNAVLAFSLFEDSARDAHANKFNFYEGSDAVLVYGVRTRNTGGYVTYQEASRIHFAFCEFDCAPASHNRALVSQNRRPGAGQGGADGSGDPVAGSTFHYWNLSLLADPRHLRPANALSLGPGSTSQRHAIRNSVLHGGGFADIYRRDADPDKETRSHNRYTGLSFWQKSRYGWRLGEEEVVMRPGLPPEGQGFDMRAIIAREIAPLFPGFTDWNVDIDGTPVDWTAPPIGARNLSRAP